MKASNRCIRWAVLAALACVIGAAQAGAATIYVSKAGNDAHSGLSWGTAKLTVQAGLNAAASGDQVWAAAGTYVQCITLKAGVALYGGFAGTETDLGQRDWVANVTTLNGSNAGSVVTAPAGATTATRIDGFTITNGIASGGGIYCSGASPTVANNTITANQGVGVSCTNASPTIANNTISSNVGVGISCSNASPSIANSTVIGNGSSGISCASSSPAITNSTITANLSVGIYCYNSSLSIANSVIASNRGNGICCDTSSCPQIINATIAGNGDSGIYCFVSSSPTIVNTIVAFNAAGIQGDGSAAPVLRYNCVYGNEDYDYSGVDDPTGSDGNISDDPMLVGVSYWNLHIQPDSPCVDAGDDGVVQAGWLDMDGQPRIMDAHVDIGADESDGTVWPMPKVIRVSPSGDDANDGLSWATAKKTVQAGINAAAVWRPGVGSGGNVLSMHHAEGGDRAVRRVCGQ